MADNPHIPRSIRITLRWEITPSSSSRDTMLVNILCEGQDIQQNAVILMERSTYLNTEISTMEHDRTRYFGHVILGIERPILEPVLTFIIHGHLELVVDGSNSLNRIAYEIRRLLIHPPEIPHEEAEIMVNARSFNFRSQHTQDIKLSALDNGPPVSANRSVLRARSLRLQTLLQDAHRTHFPIAIETTQQLQNVVNFLQGQSLVLRVWSLEEPSELQEFCREISRLQIVDRGRDGEARHETDHPLVTDVQPPMRSGSETDSGIAQRSEDSPMDVSDPSTSTGSGTRRSFFPFHLSTFRKSPVKTSDSSENKDNRKEPDSQPSTSGVQLRPKPADAKTLRKSGSPGKTSATSENKGDDMKQPVLQPSTSGDQRRHKAADTKTHKSSSSSQSPQQRDPKSRRSTEKSSSKSGKTYYPTETSEATSDVLSSDVFSSGEEIPGTGRAPAASQSVPEPGSAAAASQSVPELQSSPGPSGLRTKSHGPLKSTQKGSQSQVAPSKRRSASSSPRKKSATIFSAGEQDESRSVQQRSTVSSSQFVQQAQRPTYRFPFVAQHQHVEYQHVEYQHVEYQHVEEQYFGQYLGQQYLAQHGAQYQHGAQFRYQAPQIPLERQLSQPHPSEQHSHASRRRRLLPDVPVGVAPDISQERAPLHPGSEDHTQGDAAGPSHGRSPPKIFFRSQTSPELLTLPAFPEEVTGHTSPSSSEDEQPHPHPHPHPHLPDSDDDSY